jgi:BSD domain
VWCAGSPGECVLPSDTSAPHLKHMLEAERVSQSQRPGRSAQMVDPKPETADSGDIKIRITPQLVSDIFEQYPVVAKIYNENVPSKVCAMCWLEKHTGGGESSCRSPCLFVGSSTRVLSGCGTSIRNCSTVTDRRLEHWVMRSRMILFSINI